MESKECVCTKFQGSASVFCGQCGRKLVFSDTGELHAGYRFRQRQEFMENVMRSTEGKERYSGDDFNICHKAWHNAQLSLGNRFCTDCGRKLSRS